MKILFAGGGSIGHIAPSVAVWRAVQELSPDAECHFVCSDRAEEAEFLKKEKLPFTQVAFRRIRITRPHDPAVSFLKARTIIRHWKPDAVFSTGGALAVPVALAARMAGIPIVLHDSDAVSGRANKLMTRWAAAVTHGFPTDSEIRNPKSAFTGNPIRLAVTQGSKADGLRISGLTGKKPILLVTGGSQGSVAINDAVTHHLKELLAVVEIIHLTGKGKKGAGKHPGYFPMEFAQSELPHLYAAADMAISRGGAGNIGELAACGIPSFVVPLRGVGHDHQYKNTLAAERSGGCVLLHQEALGHELVPAVAALAGDAARRKKMQAAIGKLYVPDAAKRIATIILKTRSH